jgi:hypothetical protein
MLSDFRTALIAFFIAALNPVIFRLNFEPYSQQTYLASFCILLYYFIKAISTEDSKKNFIISGIFAFVALFSRPEAIFVLVPLCITAFLTRKKGCSYFIVLALAFQVIWILVSFRAYGSAFKTIESADQYTDPVNITGLSLGLRFKGFFLPYYFLVLGLTIIIFYYFIKGLIYFYKNYPKAILITLLIPILLPALANGAAGAKSTVYHTTHYIYLMFFISPVFSAVGLNIDLNKLKNKAGKYALASAVILSCIPLSYIKDYVPEQYNKLFPKIIQFIVTADEPEESRKLIKFIDDNIAQYPALIFDADDNASSILYIPFRTKLSPPEKIMISSYNIPREKEGLLNEVKAFMKKNPKIIIMTRKNPTLMNRIFTEITTGKKYIRNGLEKVQETEKWIIYIYSANGE